MPKAADFLRAVELEPTERAALDQGAPYDAAGATSCASRHALGSPPTSRTLPAPHDSRLTPPLHAAE
ncbi:hypothetical protein EES39_30525 [Streptomyces sp. ADI92-24]|nr:hypothetical protein EDD95_4866 [Streptomyces sp. CEV 2-1]RPK37519.1 hypothetical protein EES39_30525 [Streptomyces sp. ADI92-24]